MYSQILSVVETFTANGTLVSGLGLGHQNAGFSMSFHKFSGGDPHSGRGRPPPAPTLARPLAGRGAQAPRCWDPNLAPPSTFQPW